MSDVYYVDPDIAFAKTLPSRVYTENADFELLKIKMFLTSWQWIGGNELSENPYTLNPFLFIPGFIDEPLLLVKSNESQHVLSNVCTHRAKILVEKAGQKPLITCGYHGRCFSLDGKFRSMPEFKEVQNFPGPADDLKKFFLEEWNGFLFCAIQPKISLTDILKPIKDHLKHFPFEQLALEPELCKTYHIKSNWLTYCDNYLEGFHIPFVHPALNKTIEYEDYSVRTFDHCNVQIATCKPGQPSIPLQHDDPDFGSEIYAYYWFIYPNIMMNFYHWGISVNIVLAKGIDETEIRFFTYKRKNISSEDFLNTALDLTEMEDEHVVESVQKGLHSITYQRGRFSVRREQGVHAFHRYLYEHVFQNG